MKKIYYRVEFELKSALSLGGGRDVNSDRDLLVDALGVPFIPGTSLSGIYRAIYQKYYGEEKTKRIFGDVQIATKANQKTSSTQSTLFVYDAMQKKGESYHISKRDCVGLDECKVAKKGAKFDFEVVDAGAKFVTYLEQEGEEDAAGFIVAWMKKYGLQIGAKTKRGLGNIQILSVKQAVFDLSVELNRWLEFDMYADEEWNEQFEGIEIENGDFFHTIRLELLQSGGLSVREYTTDVSTKVNESQPDYRQLQRKEGKAGLNYAIIPGTSWAGALRHQIKKLGASEALVAEYFGTIDGNDKHASVIRISESHIKMGKDGAKTKLLSRNAIDRFTGGTVDGALYTEEYVYGGSTELTIEVPVNVKDEFVKFLAAAVADLGNGYMGVGGLSSIGRGTFSIVKLNGENVNPDQVYEKIVNLMIKGER